MRKHTETFHNRKDYKLAITVFYQLHRFENLNLWYTFQLYLNENEAMHTPTFYMKMNHFNIVFHKKRDKWQRFKDLRSGFSNWSVF